MRKKLIILLLLGAIILSGLYFTLPNFRGLAQISDPLTVPKNLEDIKAAGSKALKLLPEFLKIIWQELLEFLQKIWDWIKTIYNGYINPFFQNIWLKIKGFFIKEVEQRKPLIEKELEKEKEEAIYEGKTLFSPFLKILKIPKSLWERIRELIK